MGKASFKEAVKCPLCGRLLRGAGKGASRALRRHRMKCGIPRKRR